MNALERIDRMVAFAQEAPKGYDSYYIETHGDGRWSVNNSTIKDYEHRAPFNDGQTGLIEIIQRQIGRRRNNVGLDIAGGSDGVALRGLIARRILNRGAVTNYENRVRTHDHRVEFIAGDILLRRTWIDIFEWQKRQAPRGLALVMHRPVGALQALSPIVYKHGAHLLLDLIRPGGVLFTQIPRAVNPQKFDLDFRWKRDRLQEMSESIADRGDIETVLQSDPKVYGKNVTSRREDDLDDYVIMIKRRGSQSSRRAFRRGE